MQIIQHRINSLKQLREVPIEHGAEIDVRYHYDRLVLWHDAFHHPDNNPCDFEEWLQEYNLNGILILNIKTEGIEERCIKLMQKYKISNYFFLDLSMPYFVQYANKAAQGDVSGFTDANLAVRFSEEEAIEYALSFAGKAGWVWVDCFTKLPLDEKTIFMLKKAGFKLCLVSPELQKHDLSMIEDFKKQLSDIGYVPDAVCTKHHDLWL